MTPPVDASDHRPGDARPRAPPPRSSKAIRGLVWPLLVGAFALTASWLAWRSARAQVQRGQRAYFEFRVRDAERRIEHRLATYRALLRATRGHFLTSDVTRDGFRAFVASLGLGESYPGIQGVGYAQVVPRATLAAHVARVRAEGFPAYELRPTGEREIYTSIVLLEPFADRNVRAFGFDMHAEAVRRAARERSIAVDDVATSGKVRLVQEIDRDVQAGFLMYQPVFDGAPKPRPASGALAEAEGLRGWVYAPFRMNDFMAGVLGEGADDLEIELFDGETASPAAQLYARPVAPSPASGQLDELFHAVDRLDVGHHAWTLSVRPAAGFAARLGPDRSSAIAASGALGSLLLVALTWSLTNARGRALALAEEREGRYRQTLDQANDAILLLDLEGRIVEANPRATAHFGRTLSELLTLRAWELYPEGAREEARRRITRMSERDAVRFEAVHERKDGSRVISEVSARVVLLGEERRLLAVVRDVTDRKRTEDELQRERRRYRSLMQISQDGIHLLDEDGCLVEANEAFLRQIGRPPESIGQLNVRDWDVGTSKAELEALLTRPGLFRTRHRRADGIVFDVEVHAGPIELEGRRYVLAASRDITARVVFERELGLQQEKLEELNRSLEARIDKAVGELRAKDQLLVTQSRHAAMGEMIGNIAHQWRQPLNALGLVLANLRDAAHEGQLDEAAIDATVSSGWRYIEKMSTTISDFRDFFRPGREKAPFSALAQVRETLGLLDASFHNARIALEVESAPDARLFGFANEYSQVLLNLLANARQAIESSGTLDGRITLRLTMRDGFARLAVRDNGGGVPASILDRLFEPYFSTKEAGTGIGLYMSRQIVERSLGGRLDFANVEGGAEFTVVTPLAAEPS